MPDKVLLATLAINVLFLATGALQLGFCLVVRGLLDNDPVDGREAVRHLLYRQFPLDAGVANASLILGTFVFTLLGLASSRGRALLKIGGYMIALCGVFTLCLGVVLWVMTLRVKEQFFPVYLDQETAVQSSIQTAVRFFGPLLWAKCERMLMRNCSLDAVVTSMRPRPRSSPIRHVPVQQPPRSSAAAPRPSPALPTSHSTSSLLPSLAWLVSELFIHYISQS